MPWPSLYGRVGSAPASGLKGRRVQINSRGRQIKKTDTPIEFELHLNKLLIKKESNSNS